MVAIAAILRFLNLGLPRGLIFDEVYYAIEANQMLKHLVEFDVKVDKGVETELDTARYVVHPPLGKWCIALGEWMFGYDEFGWRIMATVFGVASILVMVLVARQLFRSTLLGCAVGLLMALDGMHFVMSRSALLDTFLMSFLVFAFACLVADREQRRARWLVALEGGLDTNRRGKAGTPALGFPWWRLAAAVFTGCALAVKWSALWYLLVFLFLIVLWEVSTRRSAGSRVPWADTIVTQAGWLLGFVAVAGAVYLASWWGWFATDDGYYRHWLADNGKSEPIIIGALRNLWHYHTMALEFHTHLSSKHTYQSWPWQWLLLGRPVAFYYSNTGSCGADSCSARGAAAGYPIAVVVVHPSVDRDDLARIRRRDWRAGTIGLGVAAGIVPWFWNEISNRTMFYFYALPAEPFLIMAVVYVLGCLINGPGVGRIGAGGRVRAAFSLPADERRLYGTIFAAAFVLIVALCFWWYYPLYVGNSIPYADWMRRMLLGNRWV